MRSCEYGWKNVQVLGIGHLAAAVRVQLRAALGAGAPDFENDSSDSLLLACSDFPNTASFRDANARALAAGGRIVFAALGQGAVRLGPVVEPGRRGCYECVASRVYRLTAAPLAGDEVRAGCSRGIFEGLIPGSRIAEADPIRGAWIGATLIVQAIPGAGATPYRGTLGRLPGATERRTGGVGCPRCLARA